MATQRRVNDEATRKKKSNLRAKTATYRQPRPTKTQREAMPEMPPAVYNIPQFCRTYDLSEAFYYKLKKAGQAPREMHIGTRILITLESAREWCRAREQVTS